MDMSLTKVDCVIAESPLPHDPGELFSVLNPIARPGCIVAGFVKAISHTVSGQIASRLALEHYLDSTSQFLTQKRTALLSGERDTIILEALERAFREANRSVYDFGHKLAAGGRMGASLLGLILYDSFIAVGKSDIGSVYIVRSGEVVPFFVEESNLDGNTSLTRNLVGANSLVNIELSSLPLEPNDQVIAFARTVLPKEEAKLVDCVRAGFLDSTSAMKFLSSQVFSANVETPATVIINLGPEGIYLEEAV